MEHHILFAFVSPVTDRSVASPVHYDDLAGAPYDAVQTNESAIICKERELEAEGSALERIFLLVSNDVKTGLAPSNEFGAGVTHIEFLEKRLLAACPALCGRIERIDYESDAKELERGMKSIAGLSEVVRRYVDAHAQEDTEETAATYIAHADLTGGYRHASIMMISILQMLSFYGIEQGDILYSDQTAGRLYHATPILQLAKLMSGMDEFVRYGSVDSLESYFETRQGDYSDELFHLIDAMHTFSDAIRVCATGQILGTVKTLGERLHTFHNHTGKCIEEQLFDTCTDILREDYGPLLEPEVSRLDIIDWCGKHRFWQQQLTLSTEWLPEYLVDHHLCYPGRKDVIALCQSDRHAKYRSWKHIFLTDYHRHFKTSPPRISNAKRQRLMEGATGGWRGTLGGYLTLYQTGELDTRLRLTELIDVLHGYFEIREERNRLNHANSDETLEIQELSDGIGVYLRILRNLAKGIPS